MKKIIIILSILLNLISTAQESLFLQGNEAYANEKYSTAISFYDSILSNGIESSELFYNLGNCYYKTQNWANAIWHYEKALKLNPNNQNASHNLELAKIKTIDQIEALPDLFYKKWWDDLVSLSSTKKWQIFAILSIWITLIINLFSRFTNFKKKYLLRFFNLLTLILFSINYSSYQENYRTNNAIIFSSSVAVNSAPTNKSTSLFSLHSGTKVEMIDEIGNWVNIKIANGNSGWIQKSNCKFLD